MTIYTLGKLKQGDKGRILEIRPVEHRIVLMNMGILVGDSFEITEIAPQGSPIALQLGGIKIILRQEDAENILVEPFHG